MYISERSVESVGSWMVEVYLKDDGDGGDVDEVVVFDCFLPNLIIEEVVAAASDDPANPSALLRKYAKMTPKCFGSRSINTASPAYSKFASARKT